MIKTGLGVVSEAWLRDGFPRLRQPCRQQHESRRQPLISDEPETQAGGLVQLGEHKHELKRSQLRAQAEGAIYVRNGPNKF